LTPWHSQENGACAILEGQFGFLLPPTLLALTATGIGGGALRDGVCFAAQGMLPPIENWPIFDGCVDPKIAGRCNLPCCFLSSGDENDDNGND
jgi:hypothetical protein